jgi:hypothetical protein
MAPQRIGNPSIINDVKKDEGALCAILKRTAHVNEGA